MNQQYIPQRSDIVWLDFEPVKGKEIGKYHQVNLCGFGNFKLPASYADNLI